MLRRVPALYQFIYILLFFLFFFGQTFEVENRHTLYTSHAREKQRDIANKKYQGPVVQN